MATFNLPAMARTRPEHGEGMARAWRGHGYPSLGNAWSNCPMPELRQCRSSGPMAARGSGTPVPGSREQVRARTGLATEESHGKWPSSRGLQEKGPDARLAVAHLDPNNCPATITCHPSRAHPPTDNAELIARLRLDAG